MSVFLQPIYTQTASGSANTINFNNIPQGFTDLLLKVSARDTASVAVGQCRFDCNNGANADMIRLVGNGSTASSNKTPSSSYSFAVNSGNQTSNTFSNTEMYIANYTTTNKKQIIVDTVAENNGTTAYLELDALYYDNGSNPITSLSLFIGAQGGNFATNSTFSLYGITKG